VKKENSNRKFPNGSLVVGEVNEMQVGVEEDTLWRGRQKALRTYNEKGQGRAREVSRCWRRVSNVVRGGPGGGAGGFGTGRRASGSMCVFLLRNEKRITVFYPLEGEGGTGGRKNGRMALGGGSDVWNGILKIDLSVN